MIKYKKSSDIKEFSKILDQDKIYSFCIDCDKIISIKKECANSEGNILVLKKEMFICKRHTDLRLKIKHTKNCLLKNVHIVVY